THVAALVDMFGGLAASEAVSFSVKTHSALEALRGYAKGNVEYRYPGELKAPEGIPNVRIYVLGPPRSEALLRDVNPSKTSPETYVEKSAAMMPRPLALSEKAAFTLAVRQRAALAAAVGKPDTIAGTPLTGEEQELSDLCFPFDQKL